MHIIGAIFVVAVVGAILEKAVSGAGCCMDKEYTEVANGTVYTGHIESVANRRLARAGVHKNSPETAAARKFVRGMAETEKHPQR